MSNTLPFGELLQTLRKRQKLCQQALADKLGVHRNTISAWECGNWLPDTRGIVADLAKQLSLDSNETEQLIEAALFLQKSQRRLRRWLEAAEVDQSEATAKLYTLISKLPPFDAEYWALWVEITEHVANTASYINNALQCVPELPKGVEEVPEITMKPRRTGDAWLDAKIAECEERGV